MSPYNTILGKLMTWLRIVDSDIREILSVASEALGLRIFAQGLGFGFNLILAQLLGPSGAGIYYLALNIVGLGAVVGEMGLSNTVIRFVAASAAQGNWRQVAGTYRFANRIVLVVAAVTSVIIFFGSGWLARELFGDAALEAPLRLMAFATLPASLLALHVGFFKGLKKIRLAVTMEGFGVSLFALLLLPALGSALGVRGAIITYLTASVLVLILGIVFWRRETPQLNGLSVEGHTMQLLSAGFPLFLIAIMNLIITSSDITLLGILTDADSVGVYGVAKRIATIMSFILVAINSIMAPKLAESYALGKRDALAALARHSAVIATLAAIPLFLIFAVFSNWLLGLFGPSFLRGGPILIVLALGQVVNLSTGSVGYLLMMTGREQIMRNIVIAGALMSIALDLILIPRFGILGAAIANAVTVAGINLGSVLAAYRQLHIWALPLPSRATRHVQNLPEHLL